MTIRSAAVAAVLSLGLTGFAAAQPGPFGGEGQQQQTQQGQQPGQAERGGDSERSQGQARIRERSGPTISIERGQTPQIVVLFPQDGGQAQLAGGQQGGQGSGGVEVVLMEIPAGSNGEGQQQQQQQEGGREIVFSSDNALNGIVSHKFDSGDAQGKSYAVIARLDGKPLKVEQAVREDTMLVLTVTSEDDEDNGEENGEAQEGQAQQGQQGQQGGEAEGSKKAVIFVYLGEAEEDDDEEGENGQQDEQQGGQEGGQQGAGGQGAGGM